ncbi:hypothetical protein [Rubrivivax gelatinosus]|uniref:hypothetical protein n=1 Tax=Rubrivivax gelatinosus TaxID=28068 RepID=UPI0005C15898|nr:hypothetical protein [Rubrivivax gelatinosus]MBG6083047.1 hypothetical protein [Rubrivivax gelatinosus]
MTLHNLGLSGDDSAKEMADVLISATREVQSLFNDGQDQAEAYIKLAFEWQYYLKQTMPISVESLVADYTYLRKAAPGDVAQLRAKLEELKRAHGLI